MTGRATVARVSRPRGELDAERRLRLTRLAEKADAAKADLRAESVRALIDGGSFAWVAAATGLSTNTLQRWKREARQ
jgi:transposase-like protein